MQLVSLLCFVFALILVGSAAPVPSPPKPAEKAGPASPPKPAPNPPSVSKATEGGHQVPAAATGADVFATVALPTHAPIPLAVEPPALDLEAHPGGAKNSGCVIA